MKRKSIPTRKRSKAERIQHLERSIRKFGDPDGSRTRTLKSLQDGRE